MNPITGLSQFVSEETEGDKSLSPYAIEIVKTISRDVTFSLLAENSFKMAYPAAFNKPRSEPLPLTRLTNGQ